MITKHLGINTQTDLEALVLENLKSPKHESEVAQIIGMSQKVARPVLRSLVKKGLAVELIDKHYRAIRRGVDFGGYSDGSS